MTITALDRRTWNFPRMLWLDMTRKCQLNCSHCYNSSGPTEEHGTMTRDSWLALVDQAATVGVEHIQLIGGEPTLHPDAGDVANRALEYGISVEVYSNLVHLTDAWWDLLQRDGMSLATSYYSHCAEKHNRVTMRPSHRHTRANMKKALALRIPLRVGVVVEDDGPHVDMIIRDLKSLGVARIGVDHVRPFGRAAHDQDPDTSGLCGRCGTGTACIGPDGDVSPCIMSGWLSVGNVQTKPLSTILSGPEMARATSTIRSAKEPKDPQDPPNPIHKPCDPDHWCKPGTPGSGCPPRR
ncbi:MoaA/NifB/PqqE/SkfB family radical SAM enzyme [Streptomonospora nanhaiensis]|uniref:MoaA/NifB/PqqE/SkfB family radical SAM enzyme n=2 Tax=Streptomonospora nanhaiensis TaxID=1323731 RepID=A0A853BSD0_9ACTN|nr:radical SAM protein [Streptomonospora nanhaiensis]NYI97411.1 MoaA/NifB/PqqE/SkfB family radical SAM enzyme [Streptomonospora nanhaiensis]